MGEVRAMSALTGSEDLTDNYRELLIDRINVKLSELDAMCLIDVMVYLSALYRD